MAFKMTGWSPFTKDDKQTKANPNKDKKQRKTKRLDRRAARAISRGNYEKAEKLANKAQLFDDTPQLTEEEKQKNKLADFAANKRKEIEQQKNELASFAANKRESKQQEEEQQKNELADFAANKRENKQIEREELVSSLTYKKRK